MKYLLHSFFLPFQLDYEHQEFIAIFYGQCLARRNFLSIGSLTLFRKSTVTLVAFVTRFSRFSALPGTPYVQFATIVSFTCWGSACARAAGVRALS